jgi:hypothetical protein
MNQKHASKKIEQSVTAAAKRQQALVDLERQIDGVKWDVARNVKKLGINGPDHCERILQLKMEAVINDWIGVIPWRWKMGNALHARYVGCLRASQVVHAYAVIQKDANASPW